MAVVLKVVGVWVGAFVDGAAVGLEVGLEDTGAAEGRDVVGDDVGTDEGTGVGHALHEQGQFEISSPTCSSVKPT